jgi:hypothetical protein
MSAAAAPTAAGSPGYNVTILFIPDAKPVHDTIVGELMSCSWGRKTPTRARAAIRDDPQETHRP